MKSIEFHVKDYKVIGHMEFAIINIEDITLVELEKTLTNRFAF